MMIDVTRHKCMHVCVSHEVILTMFVKLFDVECGLTMCGYVRLQHKNIYDGVRSTHGYIVFVCV